VVYRLTGTPLTNRPRDLFVLLQLVGHSLGRSFLAFAKRYCAAERNEYGWQTGGASNIEELTVQLHGVTLRRAKDQVLALPPKLRTWLPIDVPKGTGVSDMRRVVELLISEDTVAPASPISDRRLRGRLLGAVTKARQRLAGTKVTATLDCVTAAVEQGEKVIVFSCFEEPLQQLAGELSGSSVLVTGRTPASQRQSIVDRFQQDESVRLFLANIIAGGVGLNLTAATQVVFNGPREPLAG
jgi:SNF2 family DNA or RNA helicase